MTESTTLPRVGDAVLLENARVGIVRYVGPLHTDSSVNFGIEVKGDALRGGHDGTVDNRKYFQSEAGHGMLTREIERVIPAEELLEKVAYLYAIIKSDGGTTKNESREAMIGQQFVDKTRYAKLLEEYRSLQVLNDQLKAKNESLEFENQLLRTQSAHKVEDLVTLHNKVNSWASRFGMRRPTLSSLDDTTINEVKSLIQTKEARKLGHVDARVSLVNTLPTDSKQLIRGSGTVSQS
ncbi:restin-like protein [Reticulomyxa filosa]|uniref:Restin-like protein n=1 Tax=Reticulomyxa filosa TaxID=46433 RepID=X6NJD4_RETFI|nr:restin-like protein [Reticulomyxa filosa]|eukprot:ETO26395.1 restin-like protein [Reticulomyxa filosa]